MLVNSFKRFVLVVVLTILAGMSAKRASALPAWEVYDGFSFGSSDYWTTSTYPNIVPAGFPETNAYSLYYQSQLRTYLTNSFARPDFFSMYFRYNENTIASSAEAFRVDLSFIASANDINRPIYEPQSGIISSFVMLQNNNPGQQPQVYLNPPYGNYSQPQATFPGINFYHNQWYKLSARIDYSSRQVTWYINEIPWSSGVTVNFQMTGSGYPALRIIGGGIGGASAGPGPILIDNVYWDEQGSPSFIRGNVTNAGDGGQVYIQDQYTYSEWSTWTYNNGYFDFGNLAPSIYSYWPQYSPCFYFTPAWRSFDLMPGGTIQDFVGTATGCTRPIAGYLAVYGDGIEIKVKNVATGQSLPSQFTSGGGYFNLDVPPGEYEFTPVHSCMDWWPNPARVTTNNFDVAYISINAAEKPWGQCNTTVRGSVKNVFDGATVTLRNTETNVAYTATTNSTGQYSKVVPNGPYRISVGTSACITGYTPPYVDLVVGYSEVVVPEIVGSRQICSYRISGNVPNFGAASATVKIFSPSGTQVGFANTDASGNYITGNLVPGDYVLKVQNPCFTGSDRSVRVTLFGDVNGVNFSPTAGCVVAITGTMPGAPTGTVVAIRNTGTNATTNLSTNASGVYSGNFVVGNYTATPVPNPCYTYSAASRSFTHTYQGSTVAAINATKIPYNLTTASNPTAAGTVSPSSGTYGCGDPVTLTRTINTRYLWTNWTGDATGTGASYVLTMNGNKSATANYTGPYYKLTHGVSGPGTVVATPGSSAYGADWFLSSTSVSIKPTATDPANYGFSGWTGAGVPAGREKDDPLVMTMAGADRTVTANFLIKYLLDAQATTGGTYSYSVTLPADRKYLSGTAVRVTAVDGAGYKFVNWTGADVPAAQVNSQFIDLVMTKAMTVKANFAQVRRLTLVNTNGTVIVTHINGVVATNPNQRDFKNGEVVTLQETPNANYKFTGWSGGGTSGTAQAVNVTMDADKTVTAAFKGPYYILTAVPNDATRGTVTKSPNATDYLGPVGTNPATVVKVTAAPLNANFVFTNWSGLDVPAGKAENPVLYITMDKSKSVTANFVSKWVKLTLDPVVNGTLTASPLPDASGNYAYGQWVNLQVTKSSSDNQITGWTFDLANTGTSETNSIKMTGNKRVGVTIAAPVYSTLTVTQPSPNGTIQVLTPPNAPNGTQYKAGTVVTLKLIMTANGMQNNGWTGVDAGSTPGGAKVTMNGNKTVGANIGPPPQYTLTRDINTVRTTVTAVGMTPIDLIAPTVSDKLFSHWEEVKAEKQFPKVYCEIKNPKATTTTVKINYGNTTVKAVYITPQLKTFSVDSATALDKAISRPRVRVDLVNRGSITDFEFRYYFKMECLSIPTLNKAAATSTTPATAWTDWDVSVVEVGGGNWYVKYIFKGTLGSKSSQNTPAIWLTMACSPGSTGGCNSWNRRNDYSSPKYPAFVDRTTMKGWAENVNIPVWTNPTPPEGTPYYQAIPNMEFDPPVNQPPTAGAEWKVPEAQPVPTAMPNLTFDQAFPTGQVVLNGSFEFGFDGWDRQGGATGADWTVVNHTGGDQPLDGFRFIQVSPKGPGNEGLLLTIDETQTAYSFLSGKDVTFSAWVRKPLGSTANVTLQIVNVIGVNPEILPSTLTHTLGEQWSFISQSFYGIKGNPDNGMNKIKLAFIESSNLNGAFQIDAVTLTPGLIPNPAFTTYVWSNTRNSPMQSSSFIPGENFGADPNDSRMVVSNIENDALGRAWRTYLPYEENCNGSGCTPYFDLNTFNSEIAKANSKYVPGNPEGLPDAGNFAYNENEYENSQSVTLNRSGKPGTRLNLPSGHVAQSFYSGVNSLSTGDLGPSNMSDFSQPTNRTNPIYAYQADRDANGNWKLTWKNSFNQVLQVASVLKNLDGTNNFVIGKSVFDRSGNIIASIPPIPCDDYSSLTGKLEPLPAAASNCVNSTSFGYDSEGRRISEDHPDVNITMTWFDRAGRARFSQTAVQRKSGKYTISRYDALGRVIEVGEYKDNSEKLGPGTIQDFADDLTWPYASASDAINYTVAHSYYYDKMPPAVPSDLIGLSENFTLYPPGIENSFTNTRGRLCAVVSRQPAIDPAGTSDLQKLDAYSSYAYRYDKYGKVTETYTFNPFVTNADYKLQKSLNFYDANGRLESTSYFKSANETAPFRITRYSYDAKGRILQLKDKDNTVFASFSYYPTTGAVKKLTMDPGPNAMTANYSYTLEGKLRIVEILKPSLGPIPAQIVFAETLFYDDPSLEKSVPQYNGNLSGLKYHLSVVADAAFPRHVAYRYDQMDRLIESIYDSWDGVTNAEDSRLDAKYSYDNQGRIIQQRTGTSVSGSGGAYTYAPETNRVTSVSPGLSTTERNRSLPDNFVYDVSGQLVLDRSKNLSVSYDYRGLPLSFIATDPANGSQKQIVTRYDHSGSRIARIQFDQVPGSKSSTMILVDKAGRDNDFTTLNQAISAQAAAFSTNPNIPTELTIGVVFDSHLAAVPITLPSNFGPLTASNGTSKIKVNVVSMLFGTEEYFAFAEGRKGFAYGQASHYSHVGNELRQKTSSPTTSPTVVTDLPNGLGRYSITGASRDYYISNHLGSVVSVISSDPAVNSGAAYEGKDYFAYGKEEVLKLGTTSDTRVTEAFTGKELDVFTSLNYFGARYYDPEIGLWISPDAARQYYSAYAYSNNPTGGIDPDGNKEYKIIDEDAGKGKSPFRIDFSDIRARLGIGEIKLSLFWGEHECGRGYEMGFNFNVKGGIVDAKATTEEGSSLSAQIGTGEFGAGFRLLGSTNPLYSGVSGKLGLDFTGVEAGGEARIPPLKNVALGASIGLGFGMSGKFALTGTGMSAKAGLKVVEGGSASIKLGDVNKVSLP